MEESHSLRYIAVKFDVNQSAIHVLKRRKKNEAHRIKLNEGHKCCSRSYLEQQVSDHYNQNDCSLL